MSSFPSHSGQSYHNTSYGDYTNQGQHVSGQGTIVNNVNQYNDPLEELEKRCSPSAAFDSAARFDPPRCDESTRLRIIQIIEDWVNVDGHQAILPTLFWLHGGAGVGKSALAQSLSEKYQAKKQLAASFFFFRSDPSRNNGDQLIPTLVSQLVGTFKEIRPFVEHRIRDNRAVFTKRPQTQIQELLVEPLLTLKSKGIPVTLPQLIVIDGLDECHNPDIQCELLRVIARAISQIPYPLRFLITSRPEAHITQAFNNDPDLQAISARQYDLSDDPDADMDIRRFLENEFAEIRRVHRLGCYIPHDWLDKNAIASLVERSSGHFIYASTVIRYIRSPNHRPDDRLKVILRLRPPGEGDRPYAQLDALYALIFQGVENLGQLEKICLVLGILYFHSNRVGCFATYRRYDSNQTVTQKSIEILLEMQTGDLVVLLDPILSLISMDVDSVRILHKSLFDYLLDLTRGGHLPFDLARVHELTATYILNKKILEGICGIRDFRYFAYHCRYAFLNDALRKYLRSVEVPFPNFVMAIPERLPSWEAGLSNEMRMIIWHFFRTLSREDFDPTGRVYEKYMSNWIDYLGECTHHDQIGKSGDGWKKFSKRKFDMLPKFLNPGRAVIKMDNLKLEVDRVFSEWRPVNCNPVDAGVDPVRRVAFIKKEHRFFSAYANAYFCDKHSAITSSLVFGDYFIYSYNFGVQESQSSVIFQTYSRYGNASYFQFETIGHRDVVLEARLFVRTLASNFSDFYQKYGFQRD